MYANIVLPSFINMINAPLTKIDNSKLEFLYKFSENMSKIENFVVKMRPFSDSKDFGKYIEESEDLSSPNCIRNTNPNICGQNIIRNKGTYKKQTDCYYGQ